MTGQRWVSLTHWSRWNPRLRTGVVVVLGTALAVLTIVALSYVLLGPRLHGSA